MYFSINPLALTGKLEAMKKFVADGNAPVCIETDAKEEKIILKVAGRVASPTMYIPAKISRDGVSMVGIDLFIKVLRTYVGSEVFIKESGGLIQISSQPAFSKGGTLTLTTMPPTTTLPLFIAGTCNSEITVNYETLMYAAKLVGTLSKTDKNNPLTEAVEISYSSRNVTLAMMSSRGIVTVSIKGDTIGNGAILIPYSVLMNLPASKNSTVCIRNCSNTAELVCEDWSIVSSTYYGTLPDYRSMLATPATEVLSVDTAEFIPVLRRVDLLTDISVNGGRYVIFDLEKDAMRISLASSKGSYEDRIVCSWDGQQKSVGFFVEDLLQSVLAVNAYCTELRWINNAVVVASSIPEEDINTVCIIQQIQVQQSNNTQQTVSNNQTDADSSVTAEVNDGGEVENGTDNDGEYTESTNGGEAEEAELEGAGIR